MDYDEIKYCECGCGEIIDKYTKKGKEKRFVRGHHTKTNDFRTNMSKNNPMKRNDISKKVSDKLKSRAFPKDICLVEGCNRVQKSKGLCEKHYSQLIVYGKVLERTKFDPNEIIENGPTSYIIIYNQHNEERCRVIIDTEDVSLIKDYKWGAHKNQGARTEINGVRYFIQNLIMKIKTNGSSVVIDHINGDTLDNRKSNLRICSQFENSKNQKIRSNNTTGYKGVVRAKDGKYVAQITYDSKHYHLGRFINKIDAAKTYNEAAIKYFGEYARLNEIGN